MLSGLMTRLSKREKTVLYLSAIFVVMAFLDRAVLSPLIGKMKSLEEQITTAEEEEKKNLKIIRQRSRIEQEEKKYSSFVKQARSDEEETAALLRQIESLAGVSSVHIIDLKPSGVTSEGTVKKFTVNLSCEAQMEQLVSFIHAIENSEMLLQVAAFTISPKSKQSSVSRIELLIFKIVVP